MTVSVSLSPALAASAAGVERAIGEEWCRARVAVVPDQTRPVIARRDGTGCRPTRMHLARVGALTGGKDWAPEESRPLVQNLVPPVPNDRFAVEAARAALRRDMPGDGSGTVAVHLSPSSLRTCTISADKEESPGFRTLRDQVQQELGLQFGPVRLVEDPSLADTEVVFAFSGVRGVPWPLPNAFSTLEKCVAEEIRSAPDRLLTESQVQRGLAAIESEAPELRRCVRARFDDVVVTSVLRSLLAERMPVRDLRLILETLLHFGMVPADPIDHIILDRRLPLPDPPPLPALEHLVAGVRMGLRRQLTARVMQSSPSLTVILVAPEVERDVRRRAREGALLEDQAWCDELLDAVAQQVGSLATGQPACLLSAVDVRAALRRVVALELPELPVLSYADLAPNATLVPIGRVTL